MTAELKPIVSWYKLYESVASRAQELRRRLTNAAWRRGVAVVGLAAVGGAGIYAASRADNEALEAKVAQEPVQDSVTVTKPDFTIVNSGDNLWRIVKQYARTHPGIDTTEAGLRSAVNAVAIESAQLSRQGYMLDDIVTAAGAGQDGIIGDRIYPGDSMATYALDLPPYVEPSVEDTISPKPASQKPVNALLGIAALGVIGASYGARKQILNSCARKSVVASTLAALLARSPARAPVNDLVVASQVYSGDISLLPIATKSRDEFTASAHSTQRESVHYNREARREYINERQDLARSMRNAGVRYADIASMLGVSYSQARRDTYDANR